MPLIVKEAYFPTQNILVYQGRLAGKINDKNKVFLGKVADIPKLKPGKRYNVRVRGSDSEGNRYLPLQCKGRTDGQGTLLIEDKYAPVLDHSRDQQADNPHEPLPPRASHLALVINNIVRNTTPTRTPRG